MIFFFFFFLSKEKERSNPSPSDYLLHHAWPTLHGIKKFSIIITNKKPNSRNIANNRKRKVKKDLTHTSI